MPEPRTRWLHGALPSQERMRDEFSGSVYGAAALGYIAAIHALEAFDLLEERCPDLMRGRVKDTVGRATAEIERLRVRLSLSVRTRQDGAWLVDFGNAAYTAAKPHIDRLQFAVGNRLGRCPLVTDITAFSAAVVAQSLAAEAVKYVERRKDIVRGWTVTTSSGRESASAVLSRLSCKPVEHQLALLAEELLGSRVPEGTDLPSDPLIRQGCNAVLNVLADPKTWQYARDTADRLRAKD